MSAVENIFRDCLHRRCRSKSPYCIYTEVRPRLHFACRKPRLGWFLRDDFLLGPLNLQHVLWEHLQVWDLLMRLFFFFFFLTCYANWECGDVTSWAAHPHHSFSQIAACTYKDDRTTVAWVGLCMFVLMVLQLFNSKVNICSITTVIRMTCTALSLLLSRLCLSTSQSAPTAWHCQLLVWHGTAFQVCHVKQRCEWQMLPF